MVAGDGDRLNTGVGAVSPQPLDGVDSDRRQSIEAVEEVVGENDRFGVELIQQFTDAPADRFGGVDRGLDTGGVGASQMEIGHDDGIGVGEVDRPVGKLQ